MRYKIHMDKLKAIADPNRLKILDILSCGEACACTVLEHFNFTQPTLSHHMKVLLSCGLVQSRREGNWTYYALNGNNCDELQAFLGETLSDTAECICKDITGDCNITNMNDNLE